MRVKVSAIILVGSMIASTAVSAQGVSNIEKPDKAEATNSRASSFMRIYGPAQPPHGFVRFCEATPTECTSDHGQESRFEASAERLKELDEINRSVNKAIASGDRPRGLRRQRILDAAAHARRLRGLRAAEAP